jgi:hypothetical protein
MKVHLGLRQVNKVALKILVNQIKAISQRSYKI